MAPLQRLTRRAEFLTVAAGRRKSVAPGLILQAYPQSAAEAVRVGFTASRKVGNAVARNRARRRLRAAAAAVLPAHAARGHDYVVIARAGTLTRPYKGLLDDLAAGLKRLGVYRE
jgi:ribonuclease P protein component